MKKFFKKIGGKLSAWVGTIKDLWSRFPKDNKRTIKFTFWAALVAIVLCEMVIVFSTVSENKDNKRIAEKEIVALTALSQKVANDEANQAASDLKFILSDDKTALETIKAIKDLKTIDNGFYFELYIESETNIQLLLDGKITADKLVETKNAWPDTMGEIKGPLIAYPVFFVLVAGLSLFFGFKKMRATEKEEKI